MPGSRVYTCLSHDIVAHETTHAMLDGMHRRFNEPTNPDVLALHEAFADIVALMQHFTIPEILEQRDRPDAGRTSNRESMLGSLAVQFGQATGGRGALRDAIGRIVDGKWQRLTPDPADLQKRLTPHARGAILVAAVFDAFIAIYKARIADLLRHLHRRNGRAARRRHPSRPRAAARRRSGEVGRVTSSTCASARSTTCRRST